MTSSRALGIGAIAWVALAPAIAHAEPTAEDLASARELFKQGRALRASGDLAGAIEKLRAAHALGDTPVTGLELARALVDAGKLVEAREIALGVARIPTASDETDKSANARSDAQKLASDLAPRLASIVVRVVGASPADAPPSVTIDGERVPAAAIGEPRRVDPGAHVATIAGADGAKRETRVDLAEGETRVVELRAPSSPSVAPPVAPPPAIVPPASPPPAPSSPPPPTDTSGPRVLLIAGIATAGAGAIVTTIFGVRAVTMKQTLDDQCPAGRCPPNAHDELESARASGTIATVGAAVGVVGIAMILADVLTHGAPSRDAQARVAPDLGAGWIGAHGSF